MQDLLAAAEREEKELERKLAAVRALIAAYRWQSTAPSTLHSPPSEPALRAPRQQARASDTHELVEKARDCLQQAGKRMSAKPLLELIAPERAAEGLSAINSFSSALSRSPLFSAVRGRGYGLAEWGDADGTPAKPTATALQQEV